MDLEVVVDGEDVEFRSIDGENGDGQDPRFEWALRIETRAREIYGGDPSRITFRFDGKEGIRLLADRDSKVCVMRAIREEYDSMPAKVKAFSLDIIQILERR